MSLTLEEARKPENVGRMVIYRSPGSDKVEQGIITSANDYYVFVRYSAVATSAATRPEDLEWALP